MRSSRFAVATALALAFAGCGRSGPPAARPQKAAELRYVDPLSGGWRLERDAASTATRLVLNLVGPAGLLSRGAALNLQLPAGLRASRFDDTGMPARDGGVYELRRVASPSSDPNEPVLLLGGAKDGNLLTAGVFQKDRQATAKDSGATLLQLAVQLDAAAPPDAGPLDLPVVKARYLPDDLGAYSANPTPEMRAKAALVPMDVAVGKLSAR
jgi:hypothetical protein